MYPAAMSICISTQHGFCTCRFAPLESNIEALGSTKILDSWTLQVCLLWDIWMYKKPGHNMSRCWALRILCLSYVIVHN